VLDQLASYDVRLEKVDLGLPRSSTRYKGDLPCFRFVNKLSFRDNN
jgi:hypothetical protein